MQSVMKKMVFIILLCLLLIKGYYGKEWLPNFLLGNSPNTIYNTMMKRDLLCLMLAYPEYIVNVERGKNGHVYVIMKSGRRILYDDKKIKNFKEKLENADLQDMMEQIYPLTDITDLMTGDFDPGRFRVYSLLKEVYGGSPQQVQSNLVDIKIGYKYYRFNRNNKAADALSAVMKDLQSLMAKRSDIYSFVYPIGGTFNHRMIAGTNRLSPHAFGIAIDLARDKRDYWKWTSREEGQKRLATYPRELVQVFEKHHFIWGGKWAHFDILHFEYRPELILKAKYFPRKLDDADPWYEGVPLTDEVVKKYILFIEKALQAKS